MSNYLRGEFPAGKVYEQLLIWYGQDITHDQASLTTRIPLLVVCVAPLGVSPREVTGAALLQGGIAHADPSLRRT